MDGILRIILGETAQRRGLVVGVDKGREVCYNGDEMRNVASLIQKRSAFSYANRSADGLM